MRDSRLLALAKAGGLCMECGGVHFVRIEQIMFAIDADLPLCDCQCSICEPLAQELTALIADMKGLEAKHNEPDGTAT